MGIYNISFVFIYKISSSAIYVHNRIYIIIVKNLVNSTYGRRVVRAVKYYLSLGYYISYYIKISTQTRNLMHLNFIFT